MFLIRPNRLVAQIWQGCRLFGRRLVLTRFIQIQEAHTGANQSKPSSTKRATKRNALSKPAFVHKSSEANEETSVVPGMRSRSNPALWNCFFAAAPHVAPNFTEHRLSPASQRSIILTVKAPGNVLSLGTPRTYIWTKRCTPQLSTTTNTSRRA